MKRYLDHPIISTKTSSYLTFLIVIAPLLNFLSGINIDLYAPSMPSITHYFSTTVAATKNTITMAVFGMTIGCLVFGSIIDSIGRKRTLVFGIFLYVIASFLAPLSRTIFELMIFRFIQGAMVSSISVGCRALIIDNFSGKQYAIAILYTAITYGLGPIIGPFIGGLLQHNFGWKANFVLLGIVAGVLLLLLLLFIKESLIERQSFAMRDVFKQYLKVLQHKQFIAGVVVGGFLNVFILIYPVIAPFVVENVLHYSVLVYGNTALLAGASYLSGALINRFLLHFMMPRKVCDIGYVVLVMGMLSAYVFAFWWHLNLASLMIPIIFLGVGCGLVYPNVLAANLRQFPKNVGVAMAIQVSLITLITSLSIFLISHVTVKGLLSLAVIYTILVVLVVVIYVGRYQKLLDS